MGILANSCVCVCVCVCVHACGTKSSLTGFLCGSAGETWIRSLCLGRSPGERKGYPLQYSGLENSMDCIVHRVPKMLDTTEWFSLSLLWPMDCSLPVSSVHEISQAKILEWVNISCSRVSSQPRDWTHISSFAGANSYKFHNWLWSLTLPIEMGTKFCNY